MKNRKQWFVLMLMAVLLAGLLHYLNDYNRIMEANWGIALPECAHYRQIYSCDSGPSPHGDGIRYHVFFCRNRQMVDSIAAFRHEEGETVFGEPYGKAIEAWLDALSVHPDQRPDIMKCVYIYDVQADNSQLLLLWDGEQGKAYVLESFL